tara:strand:- start:878 stop:1162 length:285 start_codon:yes stop_codon:yes gene_type:complete
MPYKVYYSFLHRNEDPYLADEYKVYRQSISGSISGSFAQVGTHVAGKVGDPILVTGIDYVDHCDTNYIYKVSAVNNNGEIFSINPIITGIRFNC